MRFVWIAFLFAGTASAAPIAKTTFDIDGDGKPDDVELDANGALRVGPTKRAEVPATTKARIEAVKTSTGVWIVVDAGEKAYVINAKTWQTVATLPLGGVGLDREYGMAVSATPDGVFAYQTRHDVKRCDAKPAYLFAERVDGSPAGPGKRGPANPPIDVAKPAPLTAKLDATQPTAPMVYQARASSHQPGATDAGALAIPRELDDNNAATVWREDLPSNGEGQFFTFTPRVQDKRAVALRIVPGNPTSAATMKSFNRPRALVIVSAREAFRVELPDAAAAPLGSAYVIDFPQPLQGCVSVILESAHGKPQGTTAIAELQVFAETERTGGGEALLAGVIAAGKGGETAAAAQLAKRGAAAVAAIDAELAKTTNAATRRRLVAALAKIHDPAAAPVLVRAAAAGWLGDKDLLDVIAALGHAKQAAALAELAAKGGTSLEIRVAAANNITPTGAGYDALVDLAGSGPREVRRAVIERLALAPAAMLAKSAAEQTDAAASGDIWRALTRRARTHSEDRATAMAAMTTALASATDYERRYRLIDGIAAYGDAQALASLHKLLASLPVAPQSSALRQVAVRSMGSSPRADASALVIALARDADPGVRLAALSALAGAETDTSNAWHTADGPDGIDRVIITALTTDTWPEVRRRAATALGARCQRPGPARALTEAVAKDAFIDVRIDALTALVQCKAPGIRDLLAKTWSDSKAPIELRERAISAAVELDDKQLCGTLVGKFSGWRAEALSSAGALKLAQQAAVAIGQCNAPGAVPALMDALDDSAFPEIVSSAALGLGALGKTCPANAKAKLTLIARGGTTAANAARHAAQQCGR